MNVFLDIMMVKNSCEYGDSSRDRRSDRGKGEEEFSSEETLAANG